MINGKIKKLRSLPELLAPAGSPASLEAAVAGGADAVYLGGTRHNARANAENFSSETLPAAVALAHAHGVKVYFTLNTLATDRELSGIADEARAAYLAGVDALIMADLGAAATVRSALPDLPLHASTQASGHNTDAARELAALGFSRMVCAREMSLADIRSFTASSPIEAEVFVHGALCVSYSGQCLFSSLVGGRSGNRGECAQPCRLPYRTDGKNMYPLSLKDLSLARHVPELIDAGVSSLKIEGRMKSPEYVYAVTTVWRRLLDEGRGATDDEMEYLSSIFSRGGFTDGYFIRRIGREMLGIRSEQQKADSRALTSFAGITKKPPLDMDAKIVAGEPMRLTVSSGGRTATVYGDIPESAIKTPAEYDNLLRNLTKLGQTPYSPGKVTLTLGDRLAVPLSKLNALRRDAAAALLSPRRSINDSPSYDAPQPPTQKRKTINTARFQSAGQIPVGAFDYFDIIYLPLHEAVNGNFPPPTDDALTADVSAGINVNAISRPAKLGVILPAVIFDSEAEDITRLLCASAAAGVRHCMVGNIGHIALARQQGFILRGDFRLNVTNTAALARYLALGLEDVILSPELTLPQLRDIPCGGVIVYGRIPLMLLEKCAAKDISGCAVCRKGGASLTDRRGAVFPLVREPAHRTTLLNSLPTSMSDRAADLVRYNITDRHFIFTTESRQEAGAVIEAFKSGSTLPYPVRRI